VGFIASLTIDGFFKKYSFIRFDRKILLRIMLFSFIYIPVLTWEIIKANIDVARRILTPYFLYDKVDFEVPTATEGDAFSRVYLKFLEIPQSIKIIRQALEKMPAGKVNLRISEGSALRHRIPKGYAYAHVESSRGEYGYFMISDSGEKTYRVAVRGALYPQESWS